MVTWVLYLCIGIVIGGMAGFYFAKLDDFSRKQKREMEEKLRKSEQDLMNYKDQVTTHFRETATLINKMTESYQKVHEQLARGASELCTNPVEVNKLQVSPNQLLTRSTDEAVTEKAESEAPKTNIQEDTTNNKDSLGRTRISAADTAETETASMGAEGRESTESPPGSPDSAVTPPDSTPDTQEPDKQIKASTSESVSPAPEATQTMAVADDSTEDETSTASRESKETKETKTKKVRVPGSRLVH
ncbi:MAG: DUF1043 family protein [Gammaproteobacteria bacterium]|jgi:hypothetical protein